MGRGRIVVPGRRAARSERENLEPSGVRIRTGGVEMDADEDRILRGVGDAGADFEWNENIVLASHDDLEAFRLEKRTQLAGDIGRVGLFVAESARRAFVESAVAGIEHDGLHFAAALDHLRAELRLDGFREVDAGDEELVVVRDDGETATAAG